MLVFKQKGIVKKKLLKGNCLITPNSIIKEITGQKELLKEKSSVKENAEKIEGKLGLLFYKNKKSY